MQNQKEKHMVRSNSGVFLILLCFCGVVPALAQAPVDQPNELRCTSSTACKAGSLLVVVGAGGSATEKSSVVSQSGTTIKVAGAETVTGNVSAKNVSATGNVSAGRNVSGANVTASAQGAFGTTIGTEAQEEGFASGSGSETVGDYGVYLGPNATIGEPPNAGVFGETTSGFGSIGASDSGQAGTFVSSDSAAADVPTAYVNNISATAGDLVFLAIGGAVGGECFTDTSGDLTCTGTKSAVVPVDKGARSVKLYAVESPKNWFEDVGSAHLTNGSALVKLDHTFAQTVDTGVEYHVFLTPKGDCKGLYVTNETKSGFEVRELSGGTASIAFDYRIMAARKGYENVRFADATKQMKHIKNRPSVYGWSGAQK
jgi:hypothetical protein